MKNLKKPARLPRKAPSNQTGGTAWGKKLAAVVSRMTQTADMKKLILLNFYFTAESLHRRYSAVGHGNRRQQGI